jgi:hypothetical protein
MILSAVTIPESVLSPTTESPVDQPKSPTSTKRRQSEEPPEPESSKRPRLETATTNGSRHPSSPPSAGAASPPRRKSTLPTSGAEKSRNRRLFGGLLSTLSASSNKPSSAVKKRDEIEQRQRERLKRDAEEIAEARHKKREELERKRRIEQRRWNEQSTKLRHANMRAMAGFLRTETEPRIYWKPWEMSKEDEERVGRQKYEIEERIRKETGAHESEAAQNNGDGDVANESAPRPKPVTMNGGDAKQHVADVDQDGGNAKREAAPVTEEQQSADVSEESADAITAGLDQPEPDDKGKDDDNAGDEVLEGHDEDQVIY